MLKFSILRDLKLIQLKLIKLPLYVNNVNNNAICRRNLRNLKINQNSTKVLPVKNFKWPINICKFASNIKNVNNFSTNEGKYKETESSWVDTYIPSKLVPYALLARLDKPIGTWLLYLPCS